MQIIGVARLGRDAELRYTPEGTAVSNLSLAFSYGSKGQDGKKPTQWVDAALWGKLAEALNEWLVRGQSVYVICRDGHIETFTKNDGNVGTKLAANVYHIELVGGAPQDQQQQQQAPRQAAPQQRQQQAPRQAPPARQQPQRTAPAPTGGSGFDDMDDDIPF